MLLHSKGATHHVICPQSIIHNAKIITLDPTKPIVEGNCLSWSRRCNRSNSNILPLASWHQNNQLNGATVIPGFNDSHNHMLEVGIKMTRISLDDCKSLGEMRDLVAAAAKKQPTRTVDYRRRLERIVPSRETARRPGPISTLPPINTPCCSSVFSIWIRSIVWRCASLESMLPLPTPLVARFRRYPDGTPNGILRAAAKLLVRNLLPAVTEAEAVAGIEKASTTYLSYGITSIQEPGLYPWETAACMAAIVMAKCTSVPR
jgi:predicted amidohydrolase YtcJ